MSEERISPSWNFLFVVAVPLLSYLTKNVAESAEVSSVAFNTFATTPVVSPVRVAPKNCERVKPWEKLEIFTYA